MAAKTGNTYIFGISDR